MKSEHATGQRLATDQTTTMQLVQALAEAGAFDHHEFPADRRIHLLSLTALGQRLTATLKGLIKHAESELLSPAERTAFADSLRAILAPPASPSP